MRWLCGVSVTPHNVGVADSISQNDTPHTNPLLRKGYSVGYLLVILSITRNIFKWGGLGGA